MIQSVPAPIAGRAIERAAGATRIRVLMAGELAIARRPGLLDRLAARLRRMGDVIITTSSRPGRLWRAADMLITAWSARTHVDVALIEVDGKDGIRRAELLTTMLTRAGIPVVHLLRGGSIAGAVAQDPHRLGRLFANGVISVALTGHLLVPLKELGWEILVIPDPVEVRAYPYRARRSVTPHVLWVAGEESMHGIPSALASLRRLLNDEKLPRASEARMTFVTERRGRSLASVGAADLADRVAIVEPLVGTTAQELFAHHDIFVNVGDVDRAPIAVGEAMAAGLCVICLDWGGAGYLVAHGVDGLLVSPEDGDGLSDAIVRVMKDPDLAERLSRGARSRAETLDWNRALPRWREVLSHASASRRAR